MPTVKIHYQNLWYDYVEEGENGLTGYEIKIEKDKVMIPTAWQEVYGGDFKLINRGNYIDLLKG